MRRTAAAIALALCLLGCGAAARSGEPVKLLTGDLGCYAGGEGGGTDVLVAEPRYGTSFSGRPLLWPAGYTARRVGTEVIVLDEDGNVKATTGRTYRIGNAYAPFLMQTHDDPSSSGTWYPSDAFAAAAECNYPWDFIDCTANPTDTYCKP